MQISGAPISIVDSTHRVSRKFCGFETFAATNFGSLALQKFNLVENFAVTNFSTKSVLYFFSFMDWIVKYLFLRFVLEKIKTKACLVDCDGGKAEGQETQLRKHLTPILKGLTLGSLRWLE